MHVEIMPRGKNAWGYTSFLFFVALLSALFVGEPNNNGRNSSKFLLSIIINYLFIYLRSSSRASRSRPASFHSNPRISAWEPENGAIPASMHIIFDPLDKGSAREAFLQHQRPQAPLAPQGAQTVPDAQTSRPS